MRARRRLLESNGYPIPSNISGRDLDPTTFVACQHLRPLTRISFITNVNSTILPGVTLLCRTGLRTNSGCFGQSLDSPWPLDSLAQGLPALGIALFSCLSYIPLSYIRSYLYTCLYNVARFPSLYNDLAPSPYLIPFNIIHCSSSSGATLNSPMDHMPTRSNPATSLWPSAIGSPLWGSG